MMLDEAMYQDVGGFRRWVGSEERWTCSEKMDGYVKCRNKQSGRNFMYCSNSLHAGNRECEAETKYDGVNVNEV